MLILLPDQIQDFVKYLKFENVLDEFREDNYTNVEKRSKMKILFLLINHIIKNPILGLGASGSFPILYYIKYQTYIGHTHNLFLELSFNYGLVISLLVFISILYICYLGFMKIYFQVKGKIIYLRNLVYFFLCSIMLSNGRY